MNVPHDRSNVFANLQPKRSEVEIITSDIRNLQKWRISHTCLLTPGRSFYRWTRITTLPMFKVKLFESGPKCYTIVQSCISVWITGLHLKSKCLISWKRWHRQQWRHAILAVQWTTSQACQLLFPCTDNPVRVQHSSILLIKYIFCKGRLSSVAVISKMQIIKF